MRSRLKSTMTLILRESNAIQFFNGIMVKGKLAIFDNELEFWPENCKNKQLFFYDITSASIYIGNIREYENNSALSELDNYIQIICEDSYSYMYALDRKNIESTYRFFYRAKRLAILKRS